MLGFSSDLDPISKNSGPSGPSLAADASYSSSDEVLSRSDLQADEAEDEDMEGVGVYSIGASRDIRRGGDGV